MLIYNNSSAKHVNAQIKLLNWFTIKNPVKQGQRTGKFSITLNNDP